MKKILTMIFVSLLSSICIGQETERAERLELTGTQLPPAAQRIVPKYIPSEIETALDKVVAESGGKLRRTGTEVLLWTGDALKRTTAQATVDQLTRSFTSEGWRYQAGKAEYDISVFTLLKDGSERRAIVGLYGEAEGTLIFALTEFRPGGEPDDGRSDRASMTTADYSFTTPPGWSRRYTGNGISLTKDGGKNRIDFLPTMSSSGDLERDAATLMWKAFSGYDAWYSNGFAADYGTFEKGKTAQGLDYYRIYRYAKRSTDANDGFAPSRCDVVLVLIKVGARVAVIAGRQPFQSDYARDSTMSAIDLILYDLTIKGASGSADLRSEILGSWSSAGGSASLAYTFAADGTFSKGAASGFRVSHDEHRDKVTMTSYGLSERYSLAGNTITQTYKRTGEVVRYKVRVYQTKYDKDPWQQKMGFLSNDGSTGTIVLRRGN